MPPMSNRVKFIFHQDSCQIVQIIVYAGGCEDKELVKNSLKSIKLHFCPFS